MEKGKGGGEGDGGKADGGFLGMGIGEWRLDGVGGLPACEVDSGAIFPGQEVREGIAFCDDGGPGPSEASVSCSCQGN